LASRGRQHRSTADVRTLQSSPGTAAVIRRSRTPSSNRPSGTMLEFDSFNALHCAATVSCGQTNWERSSERILSESTPAHPPGSQETPRWREMDSNHLSLMGGAVDLRRCPGSGRSPAGANPRTDHGGAFLGWRGSGSAQAEIHRIDAQQSKAGHQRGVFVEVPAKPSS
jgi:hypothetical protein